MKYIPGFRSNDKYKRLAAISYYAMLIFAAVGAEDPTILIGGIGGPIILFNTIAYFKKKSRDFLVVVGCILTLCLGILSTLNPLQIDEEKVSPTITQETTINTQLHFVDTGQSDCILIESDGEFMLIDGGDKDDDERVKAYLQKAGVQTLKYVVATHFHADHLGGLDTVVRDFDVEKVFVPNGDASTAVYREFIQSCIDRNLKPSVPLDDVVFELGHATFRFLNVKGGYNNTNNNSLIVELTSGETKALFTGDAEKEVEYDILDALEDIDILKVAHHGSSSSTTDAFLDRVKPEVAIIQTATGNRYGHPHVETMEKLQKRGIIVHRNDECGDIVYTITEKGYKTDCEVVGSYKNGKR